MAIIPEREEEEEEEEGEEQKTRRRQIILSVVLEQGRVNSMLFFCTLCGSAFCVGVGTRDQCGYNFQGCFVTSADGFHDMRIFFVLHQS